MWHVSSRSGVATLWTAIHLLLTQLLTLLDEHFFCLCQVRGQMSGEQNVLHCNKNAVDDDGTAVYRRACRIHASTGPSYSAGECHPSRRFNGISYRNSFAIAPGKQPGRPVTPANQRRKRPVRKSVIVSRIPWSQASEAQNLIKKFIVTCTGISSRSTNVVLTTLPHNDVITVSFVYRLFCFPVVLCTAL